MARSWSILKFMVWMALSNPGNPMGYPFRNLNPWPSPVETSQSNSAKIPNELNSSMVPPYSIALIPMIPVKASESISFTDAGILTVLPSAAGEPFRNDGPIDTTVLPPTVSGTMMSRSVDTSLVMRHPPSHGSESTLFAIGAPPPSRPGACRAQM